MTFTLHPRDPSLHAFLTGADLRQNELEAAHRMRRAAQARYDDAKARNDTRDLAHYAAQVLAATNRVLTLEARG